ncbi:MAG: DNA polymerase III subunit gamma/tau [Chitinophagaceae bacterium]|nr:MAG: DNA polymerase III subunit gamma/tau [Chitinophagaceae bacterium]
MDKFIVSARKYRPQLFDTVVGQSHITTTLKNAIRHNQLAHAFLFCGPRGVGKTTCARILAKTINCENQTKEGEACNKCNSCISFNEGTSMNIHELDAASNNSVDDIRTLVDQVRFAPQAGKYKVYIIDEVHMLSASAFNAFLKTLEEPPSYAIFILATTEKHKILPTILSRCQIFDFKRITTNDTVVHLQEICDKEEIKADKAALQVIAQKSEGCMRDALSILDKIVSFTNGEVNYLNTLEHLNILDADYYFKLMDCMLEQNLSGAMLLYDDINRKGFEGDLVVNGFAEFIRNLLVCRDEKTAGLLEVVENFKEKYMAMAKKTSPAVLISALNILNETEINYKAARNKRLHVELALIKLCYLQQAIELTAETNGISKKKITETSLAFRTAAIKPFKVEERSTVHSPQSIVGKKQNEAKLIIETSVLQEEPVSYKPVTSNQQPTYADLSAGVSTQAEASVGKPATNTKLSALDKIRNQVKGNESNGNGNDAANKPIQQEELQQAWNEYVAKLKSEKNPAGQNFEMAELRIQDDNSFIALVFNNIQFRFIEQEGLKVSQYLREKLHNHLLRFFIVMEENKEMRVAADAPLTSREQFLKMAEQYPLVKELKDRLRLELDY